MAKGNIYLIPITLGADGINDCIPIDVQAQATALRYFIVENIKTARRYLRRLDREFPIDESVFFEINKRSDNGLINGFLKHAVEGNSIGIISEAGCPGVADPGAEVVSRAHELGLRIFPLVGPSSILLALMGSGFSGQEFTFNGYLPKDRKERIVRLKDFEMDTLRTGKTHLFMDTPYRNMNVLEDLLNELSNHSLLCIASNITFPDQDIRTMSVKAWREHAYDLSKKPTIFAIGRFQ